MLLIDICMRIDLDIARIEYQKRVRIRDERQNVLEDIKMDIERDMLQAIPMSRTNVGSGIKSVARIATNPAAKMMLLFVANFVVSNAGVFNLFVSAMFFL